MKNKFYQSILLIFFLLASAKLIAQDNKPVEITNYTAVILVNTEFKYQVTIKTLIAVQPTSYKLTKFPDGMTIDEKTGIIKWTPKTKGEYTIEAQAYLNTSVLGSSVIKLKVVDLLGSVTGVVKSSDDKPLPFAYITLYKKVTTSGSSNSYTAAYSGSTDSNGSYKIPNVEFGTYVAYAWAKQTEATVTYQPVYYIDATTIDKATPINVTSATPVEVNFKLPKTTVIQTVITSYSATIKIGTEWKYQVVIKLPDGVTSATYRLTARPDGMTINEQTGLVTWTPKTKGTFSAQVTVTAKEQKIALINMKLTVISFAGSVTGIVTNSDGQPIQYVTISLLKKVSTTEKQNSSVCSFSEMTDANGKYTIANVDSGSYYVYARPGYEKILSASSAVIYQPVYYDNAQTIDKATAVPIINTTPVTVNFKLQKYVKTEPAKANIAGTVTDVSGKAIAGAKILISQTKPTTNNSIMDGINFLIDNAASSLSEYADVLSDVKTDANGKYTVNLTAGNSYIVYCLADGYIQQFYNGKSSILDANKILLKRDTTGIDFKLASVPVAKAIISGTVVDSLKAPVVSKVILYSVNVTTNIIDKGIRTAGTNEKGEFAFEKVANGKYYLQVIPVKDYIPAYYKLNDCGVREVKLADQITVANDANVSGITVCVKKVKASGGGKISGLIKNNYGEPIGGVIVIAESTIGSDLSFDISNSDGSYDIENLGVGVYNVYSDKPGYSAGLSNNALIDYQNNAFNTQVNLIVNPPIISDVNTTGTIPTQFELKQNYPNPFNPSTIISWQITSTSYVSLKVFDMLGREVATLVDGLIQPGVYNSQFSIGNSQLSSGIYFYRLQAGNFVETKKMMLIK